MNILFVDLALKYINPTRNLLPALFSSENVKLYGPGYVSNECLAKGIQSFIDKHGPFDALVATEHIFFSPLLNEAKHEDAFRQNYYFHFSQKLLQQRAKIFEQIRKVDLFKVALTLETDYYALSNDHISIIDNEFNIVIGWGSQFFQTCESSQSSVQDAFMGAASDNWLNFCEKAFSKIIPLAHFVSHSEFNYTNIENRPTDFCVPGESYVARKRALQALYEAGEKTDKSFAKIGRRILKGLGFSPLAIPWFQDYYMSSFKRSISRAKLAYTCGSSLNWPIRKFFEIPALGTILFCQPCNGFNALGFVDGMNAVVCSPEEFPTLGKIMLSEPERANEVAIAGRDLIQRYHSLHVRAHQCSSALEIAIQGKWSGAVWKSGKLEYV